MCEPIFVDTKEAAEMLALKPSTLRIWRSQGKGPKFVKPTTGSSHSKALYNVEELKAWAASLK